MQQHQVFLTQPPESTTTSRVHRPVNVSTSSSPSFYDKDDDAKAPTWSFELSFLLSSRKTLASMTSSSSSTVCSVGSSPPVGDPGDCIESLVVCVLMAGGDAVEDVVEEALILPP